MITNSTTMAVLESCPKHNMVAYLEKTDENAEFHEIIDFLAQSSIHNALTVSPVVSTTFVEQFWMSAKSKIINNVRHITAKVVGNPVSISEASIRSDLLFDDANGIDSLPNQAIFDAIQLIDKQLMNVPVPLDHFPVNALTSEVFSFMVKRGKHFSGKVTPLFASIEVQVEPQSDPSPRSSPSTHIPDSILKSSGGNHGGKKSLKKNWMPKESVSRQGRKSAKAKPSVHKNPLFDELPDHTLDYMDTEDAQDVGRTREVVNEEKEAADDKVSTEDTLSTAQQKVSTDRPNVSTDRPEVNTDKEKDSTVSSDEGTDDQTKGRSATPTTPTTTPTMFGDDETIAQVLLNMSQAKAVSIEKEKGPLPTIDPKDKEKKKIEEEDESDTESEGIPEAEKKFKQLARDEEMARKVQEARIEADRLLALRLQDEEREQFTVEERAKFLQDTIAAQRRFLAEQRAIAIRNRPPIRTQLRNQMMTYLKHVGNKKHSDLKNKTFEEIQALYEKMKRFDESFTAVGSTEDEKKIKEMNERVKDPAHKSLKKKVVEETLKKEDTDKVPAKQDVKEQGTKKRKGGHIKMIARKKKRPQSDVDSDDEHRKCLKIVTFEGTIDSEIMERKSVIARLDKVSSPDGDYLVIYRANGNFRAFNYLMEIMMESSTEENDQSDFWNDQQDWKIVTWKLYEACRVYILESEDGIVIHMLVERRYPLSKDLLQRMLDFGLEVERESAAALDLIRFIKQQIDEE
ncbi:hypothetical protein Tco_0530128 [Tanacetum coccineum]